MSSQQLWSSLKKKPRWPNPEESIGQFYGEKQGRLCWRAQGAAREAFSQIASAIKDYLNSCSDAVPGADWVTWSIYMIGKSKSTAVPTIMFECFQRGPRKEAMDMVRKSGILNEHPGIETGHWSFPPNIVFPQQLALTSLQSDATSSDVGRAVGPQITVQTSSNETVEYRKATVGGLLRANGKNYYFTVNHPFSSGHRIVPWPSSLTDFDDECEFGGQSDAEDDDDDEALADVTSKGSRTPESSSDCNSDDDAANSGSLQSSGSEGVSIPVQGKLRTTKRQTVSDGRGVQSLLAEESGDVEPGDEGLSRKEKAPPVVVSIQDLCIASPVLDYTLILSDDDNGTMSVSDHVSVPFSKEGIPFISLKNVAEKIPKIASIVTMTGSSGLITGALSGLPSYTRLPGTGAYQEVFTVKLDGALYPGDCGSCVFSAETGALYGHIVAGSTVTQVAYVLPAAVVFKDIFLQIERLDQKATSLSTYPSYCFEFGELAKHLTRIDSLPGPAIQFDSIPMLYNDLVINDPEVEFTSQNATSLPRSSQPRDSDSVSDPLVECPRPYLFYKQKDHPPSETHSRRGQSLIPLPTRLQYAGPPNSPQIPSLRDLSWSLAPGQKNRRTILSSNVLPTIRTRVPTSASEAGQKVGSLKEHVNKRSRPINTEESWALYHFETHAQKCAYCCDPYEVHRNHEQLCDIGQRLAQDIAAFMYYRDDEVHSTVDMDGKPIRLELPEGYVQSKGLLKAVERSLRHRFRTPFVSMDRTYHVPRTPVRSRSIKLIEQPSKERSRPRSGEIVDWPSRSPLVGKGPAGQSKQSTTIEINNRRRPSKRGSLYEQDLATPRGNSQPYTVEVREPSSRDVREHRLSGYYR